jgi:hypothetical protein
LWPVFIRVHLRHLRVGVVLVPAFAALRLNTQTGRPLASDFFLSKLGHTLGRRLRSLPVGRPKKQKSETREKCK